MFTMRFLIVAALCGAVMYGDEITVPLADGSIVVKDVRFFLVFNIDGRIYTAPEFSFKLVNQTSSEWKDIVLQFDVGLLCEREFHRWSPLVHMSLDWYKPAPGYSPAYNFYK